MYSTRVSTYMYMYCAINIVMNVSYMYVYCSIQMVHWYVLQSYLEAGADFVETNSFNGTSVSQSDYDTQHLVRKRISVYIGVFILQVILVM